MLRLRDFKIVIRRGSKVAVFLEIAHAVIDAIKRGRLMPWLRLPGSRELAESLEINRKTVIQAYAELEAQGWVTSEKTRGTFGSARLPETAEAPKSSRRKAGFPSGRISAWSAPRPTFPSFCPKRTCWCSMTGPPTQGRSRWTHWPAPIATP